MAYKPTEVAAAITQANGMLTVAAQILGCHHQTLYNHMEKHPSVKAAYEKTKEKTADRIETTLLDQALGRLKPDGKTYEREPNMTALIFLAKAHPMMRSRGYTERRQVELVGADGKPLEMNLIQTMVNVLVANGQNPEEVIRRVIEVAEAKPETENGTPQLPG